MKPILTTLIVSVSTLLFLISGCLGSSAANGDTWLIIVGTDTVTVSRIGEAWNGLDQEQREYFTGNTDPVGQYILTYTRKLILQTELETEGYLSDPGIVSGSDSWLGFMTVKRAHDYFLSVAETAVTVSDLQFYRDHIGKSVWYTLNPGTDSSISRGPDHLPELSFGLASHLDTLSIGQAGSSESGIIARLDSVEVTDAVLISEALADTAACNRMATNRIANGRNNRWMNGIRNSMVEEYSISVDTAALSRLVDFYSGNGELIEEIVVESDLGNWSAAMVRDEINFLQSRIYVQPTSLTWQFYFIENLIFGSFLAESLQQAAPLLVDSLRVEAESYLFDLASEKYYDDMVSSEVTVTGSDIEEQFNNLEGPFIIEEMRSVQAVIIPPDHMEDYRAAIRNGSIDDYAATLNGLLYLAVDSARPQITRLLRMSDIPGGFGREVFLIDRSDTTSWTGPFQLTESTGHALFRLIDVVPEREALLEEVRIPLELMVRTRLEEEATVALMQRLEFKYEPRVNDEVLENLPVDPGLWESL
ncbi:hypothetical protein DRQ25_06105 [Candidatus Fermentibacteria bacterium]|nr:MAG: hypothetical protein DRQ25_06105 [Candidatus Fermentibacteria bacterium]